MKIRWQYFMGGLLALLGFSSCEKLIDVIGGGARVMYGQPNANFKLVGDVTDAAGKPVKGIRVVALPNGEDKDSWQNDTTYSNAEGHFEVERLRHDWPDEFQKGAVKLEDADGEQNGRYRTKVLKSGEFSVKQTRKGSGEWYQGDYTITADTRLDKED